MAVFEKQYSRLIVHSSPGECLKEAVQIAEQESWPNPKGLAPGHRLGAVLLAFVAVILWVTHSLLKKLLHPRKGKNHIGDKRWIILSLADAREQCAASKLLQRGACNGSRDVLPVPGLSPPAQRRMSVVGHN